MLALGHRAAAERESPRETRWRNGLSLVFPMVSLFFAGLGLIGNASGALGGGLVVVSVVAWSAMLVGITVAQLASMTGMWDAQNEAMVTSLSDSAASGWVGTLLKDSAEYVIVLDAGGRIVFASPRTRSDLADAEYFSDLVTDPETRGDADHPGRGHQRVHPRRPARDVAARQGERRPRGRSPCAPGA